MERAEQLKLCKICAKRKFDFNRGIICGLTDEPATFEGTCDTYEKDDEAIRALETEALYLDDGLTRSKGSQKNGSDIHPADLKKHAEGNRVVKSAANWFYIIGVLSLVNSISTQLGSEWGFIVGLGIPQFIDGLLLGLLGEVGLLGLLSGIVFSATFAVIGYYASKHNKNAFVIGMVLYAFDLLLFVILLDILSIGFHAFALFMIYKGYKHVKENEKEEVF